MCVPFLYKAIEMNKILDFYSYDYIGPMKGNTF
jgi:hypothetical protein